MARLVSKRRRPARGSKGGEVAVGDVVRNQQGLRGIVRKIVPSETWGNEAEVLYSKAQQWRQWEREGVRRGPVPEDLRGKGELRREPLEWLTPIGRAKKIPRLRTVHEIRSYGDQYGVSGVWEGKGKPPRRAPSARGRLVANLGDQNPFSYGGYLLFKQGGSYQAVYWEESASDDASVEVYGFDVPKDVFEEYNWANPDDVARTIGADPDELRRDGRSRDARTRAQVVRDIGGYYGFENLDSYPTTETPAELRKRYGRSVSLLGRRRK